MLRAHPDLAGKLAVAGELTADSKAEQASAGLDRLSPEEHARFTELNSAYIKKFGFPFIIAVKGLVKEDILAAFEQRIDNSAEEEFEAACAEVERIARLRLRSMLPETTMPDTNPDRSEGTPRPASEHPGVCGQRTGTAG